MVHALVKKSALAASLALLAASAQNAFAFSPYGTDFDFETDLDTVLPPTEKANTDSLHQQSYPAGMTRPGDQTAGAQDFSTANGSRTEELAISAIQANSAYMGPTASRDGSDHVAILFRGNEGTYDSVSYGPPNSSGRSNVRPTDDPFGYSVDLWLSPHVVPGGTTDNVGSPAWTSIVNAGLTGHYHYTAHPDEPAQQDNPGIQEFLWTNGVQNSDGSGYLTEVGAYVFVVDSNGTEPGNTPAWRFVSQVGSEITLDAGQWVTMEMTFDNSSDDNTILGTFRVLNADHSEILFEAVRDTNVSAANLGGLRYSWFTGMDYSIDRLFVDNWSSGAQLAVVPEPASLGLLGLGALGLVRRRRKA